MNDAFENTVEMPYFIKPSIALPREEKTARYQQAQQTLKSCLEGETHPILIMSTINCILKTLLPYYYWVGFYMMHKDKLIVGPYQGTMGCLHIAIGKGVCGAVAKEGKTKIVKEVHQLAEGEDHITCDPNSQSEIVVPVFDNKQQLIAVFDVDSTLKGSFDEIDQQYLESIMRTHFSENTLE